MTKSEALRHVQVSCVDEVIDEAMEFLPVALDLAVPENREKIRGWMQRVCKTAIQRSASTIAAAASNAVAEALELVIDPCYHEKKTKRRKERAAKRALLKNKNPLAKQADYAFARLTGKETRQ